MPLDIRFHDGADRNCTGRALAVPLSIKENELTFGTPQPLFSDPLPIGSEYDAAPDGQRFLNRPTRVPAAPLLALSNWNRIGGASLIEDRMETK
jgi:hypothetical protein